MKSCNFCYNGGKNFELGLFDEKFNGGIFLGVGFYGEKFAYIIRYGLCVVEIVNFLGILDNLSF